MNNFGSRLSQLRRERKLSQYDMANILNMSRSTYSGWETEGKQPDFSSLMNLADFFDVSVDYLVGHSDDRGANNTIYASDFSDFKKNFDDLPKEIKPIVVQTFNNLYSLLNHDLKNKQAARLEIYSKLFSEVQRIRNTIRYHIEDADGILSNPASLATIMNYQAELKSVASGYFDDLMQVDIKNACSKV